MSPDRRVGIHRDATTPSPNIPDSMMEQTIMTGRRERTPPTGHRVDDVRLVDRQSESSPSPTALRRMLDLVSDSSYSPA